MSKLKNYYFTFGQIHVHPQTGILMKDHWVRIVAHNIPEARKIMCENYSNKWAFQYDETNFRDSYFPGGEYEVLTF